VDLDEKPRLRVSMSAPCYVYESEADLLTDEVNASCIPEDDGL